ncbi:MAG: asparagine synthase (glutamine-hydrolyzing) [Desulfuromonadales bacterium]|nr:asparagine synthase (glutamine-hydrolyzing) [Desulfuromonadales bacterium]
MCGICGYVGDYRPELLASMCCAMVHRGPDDFGVWHDLDSSVGLGHRRLSIIDLSSAGHQPMANRAENIRLSYNGEIYNFKELRNDLISKGYEFRSQSDTEVVLYLYEEYGLKFLTKLNGIFALGIWDERTRKLILARDHAGVKPLYYWQSGNKLFFASEIKALLKVPEIPREVNIEAIPSYLTFLWVPGEETMLRGIRKVEPGQYLLWQEGKIEKETWFSLNYEPDCKVSDKEWIERVHTTFMAATKRQMMSDVKLGAFLSGGLDSSSIVASMRNTYPDRQISCYTMAFDAADLKCEGFADDLPYAKKVAEHLDVDMNSIVVSPESLNLLPKIIYQMEEPDADPTAILTYLVSKMAREDGTTVLLSGTGGDEVFFGYRSHQAFLNYERLKWMPKSVLTSILSMLEKIGSTVNGAQGPLSRRARKFKCGLLAEGLDRHMEIVDWSSSKIRKSLLSKDLRSRIISTSSVPDCMNKYFESFSGSGEINRHSHLLVQTFLAAHNFLYTDKCSMATSVETRVPFMDVELMQLCAIIPERVKLRGKTTKYPLKKAMERYLPSDVLYRSKTGFTPPLRQWIMNSCDTFISDLLSEDRIKNRGFFSSGYLKKIINENKANAADHSYLIYALMSLELWIQSFIDNAGVEVDL